MGCRIRGANVPTFWMKFSMERRFLFACLLFVLSDAAQLINFPGSTICQDKEIQIKKPKDVHQSTWQSLRIVDSSGLEVAACLILPEGSLLNIPERCINHETGRRVAHISLNDSMGNVVYQISCIDEQADSEYMGPIIECNQEDMMAIIPRTLSGFDDEIIITPPPTSTWTVGINNGTLVKVNVVVANRLGYILNSDTNSLMIRVNFNAFGLKEYISRGQKFYRGDIALIQDRRNPKTTLDVKLICARGPPACNTTHMTISIPPFDGSFGYIYTDQEAPLTASSLQQQGMTLDTRDGVQLSIKLENMQSVVKSGQKTYYLPSLTLVFVIDGLSVPMALSPQCVVVAVTTTKPSHPSMTKCTQDGFMVIEVVATNTKPSLDVNTVTLRDPTCQPQDKSNNRVVFKIPLNGCGTTKRFVGGKIVYENEVSALWKNLPPRRISRDSELRETVWCYYNGTEYDTINVNVATLPPPVSTRNDGPLLLVINLYPDVSYRIPYSDDQYPIVKTLRDAIFLEVQVLNRNDPNIELVLDDCWATMSQDPKALPQWNVVVDGCQASQDNYLTILHSVDVNVPQATLRKRFEVKAFAFMQGGELSTNLVYFHCSAIICNIRFPDSPLCTKLCLPSRTRRDELFLHRHSNLASLPGPVLLLDSEPSMILEDEQDVIKQVTIGVLPAFALVAVVVLVALFAYKQKSKS
ncbi:zona pellucida sperm-binding protein 2 [Rhinoderma darwinii]|uniref:zona pellucida sperm-binding protein 2 n=1 Tax=Rhinoderma darwinii TaxID=43563 RepID=UPI003F67C6BD